MVDDARRTLLGASLLPLLFSSGCLETFGRDDTVKVSNESDEKRALTVRFTDKNADSVVSERELTLNPGTEKQYKVNLPEAGDESSHYVVTVTTRSGLRKTHDLGDGVFYILYVTLDSGGLDFLQTER